ncbi:uncharacterized protein THITE_2123332 [Thermothielavioides terrestris NRRL 8126]|uniref:Uncharacterized protein n=1 Tax=Thermothielavioides terrestris (strain ATCC 38088 / NRRL 8126) TaxID=578455 RepID=G2RH74_THETT|nr:uncharacterized protein THITE_2123332 [Thermothielavioides terrestris NRRL 8126]AEO71186.1 hypothetical protein THITE_2123332 [Thermothielavioides terrestris NRRL 8126]
MCIVIQTGSRDLSIRSAKSTTSTPSALFFSRSVRETIGTRPSSCALADRSPIPLAGLWQPALSLDKDGFAKAQSPQSIKKHLLRHAEKRLGAKMGTKYRDVVVKCLTGDFHVQNDNKEDLKLQQAFRSQVVNVLQRAAESI